MRPILVVGDWIVDEHWVVGLDRSTTASRRGEEHYHALTRTSHSVEALCGAGTVGSLLHQARHKGKSLFEVHGVGSWHPEDQDALQAMMGHHGLDGHNRYRVTRQAHQVTKKGLQLHSVHSTAGGHLADDDQPPPDVATTRVIRVYVEHKKKGVIHKYRLDWETPPLSRDGTRRPAWISTKPEAVAWWNAHKQIQRLRPQAIVIKDLVKGVVSDALIDKLIESYGKQEPRPRWYVSSKEWHLRKSGWELAEGSWLARLKGQDVRLVFVPQVAASAAVSARSINSWKTPAQGPSWHAMQLMDALAARFRGEHNGPPEVAVLPEGSHLFLRTARDANPALMMSQSLTVHREDIVPVSSVLFSALVGLMESQDAPRAAADVLAEAVDFTSDWMKIELVRFTPSMKTVWNPSDHRVIEANAKSQTVLERQSWSDLLEDWQKARQGLGILDERESGPSRLERSEPTIELWRAMTDIDGYICLVSSKREAVRAIKRELETFVQQKTRTKHVSMLLESEPGSGKTFLLDKLADELGMELVQFNVTRMTKLTDILDCFDEIASRQSSASSTRPLLVFFDEINAPIANSPVYGTFLDPIDRGTYTRGGRAFFIRPCAWVFAGTGMGQASPETKGSDFKSRLTLAPLKFSSGPQDETAALERTYIGANTLIDLFPDVTHASDLVLRAFQLLPPDASLRDQNRLIARFKDVQPKTVWATSVPDRLIEEAWNEARDRVGGRSVPERESFENAEKSWRADFESWRAARDGGNESLVRILSKPD